jgi:hypothetical protein
LSPDQTYHIKSSTKQVRLKFTPIHSPSPKNKNDNERYQLTPKKLLITLSIRHMRHLGTDGLAFGDVRALLVLVAEEGAAEVFGCAAEAGAVQDAGFPDSIL